MLATITTCYFLLINIFPVITTKSKEHITPCYFNGKTIHPSGLDVKAKKLFSIYKNRRDSVDFSFISGNQSIHIWTKDFKSFKGRLTNFTSKTSKEDIYPKHYKKYKKTLKIDPKVAKKVYAIFNDSDILCLMEKI